MTVNQETAVKKPIIIVGAGPVGLLTAIILAEAERNHKPTTEWRAAAVHSRVLEMLSRYGLTQRLMKLSNPFTEFRVQVSAIRSEYPMILGCGQDTTEKVMHERLAELNIYTKWGWEYVSHEVIDDNEQLSVQLKNVDSNEIITRQTPYLIGCDGGHSKIRKSIGAKFDGKFIDHRIAVCDIIIDADWMPTAGFVKHSEGFLGITRAHLGNRFRIFTFWGPESPEVTAESLIEVIRRRVQPCDLGEPHILSYSAFSINERRASQYISDDGRVFICGDAAHVHSPAGGQGMNTGLQDAENLAWKLGMVYNGHAKSDILKSYATERIPVADGVLKLSGNLLSVLLSPVKMNLFSRLMPLMGYLPIFLTRPQMEKTAQLSIQYPVSNHGGIFADTPAWTKATSPWFSFLWSADSICLPGSRAVDCKAVDVNNRTSTRVRNFYEDNNTSYKGIIFIDGRKAAVSNSKTEANTSHLPADVISQLTDLMVTFEAYQSPVKPIFVIYGLKHNTNEPELPTQATSLAKQLNKQFNNVPVLVDLNQGKQYDNLTMADMYKCTKLGQHAVYLIRPDTYVAARMLLSEAAATARKHLDAVYVSK
ncbi:FAD binding domain-containing protein [Syncephalis fuscata]|nr:FAD binding domain-containing protein [Syncephalis fuscata]